MRRRNQNSLVPRPKAIALAALTLLAVGCSRNELSDLQQYVQEVKARPAGRIPPLPEFETYETFVYQNRELRDPFVPKDEATITQTGRPTGPGLRPDMNRRKEALENFPLDGLKFVGLLENSSDSWAIIKAPDNLVYRAKVGNHIGQNYGEVVSVDESKVRIVEIIADGLGGWIKRDAALAIEE